MKQKPLSPTMKAVVQLMREGWPLCYAGSLNSTAWLQKEGCGCGGATRRVSLTTFHALYDRGLLKRTDRQKYGTHSYVLKEP